MDARTDTSPDDRPRVGRPPRISRQMIAEAAQELGLEGLTLRAVADRLGVSIAALYHHVSGKDELMRLAAEHSAAKVPLPRDRGQHWAVWLYEWAAYNRDAFVTEPGLLAQYVEGAISTESIARQVDVILAVLVRQGFTIVEASAAYDLVSAVGLGMAAGILRARRAVDDGLGPHGVAAELADPTALADLPHVRELLAAVGPEGGHDAFRSQVTSVLVGIAAQRGDDWRAVARVLAGDDDRDDDRDDG
ncbi:MAG TPA: TetR family transcriptional regulator [Acidimicrobiales bacterium]|nr:TetR family transcriptional regulator [Acidimicrobiales bacterium]